MHARSMACAPRRVGALRLVLARMLAVVLTGMAICISPARASDPVLDPLVGRFAATVRDANTVDG